MEFKDFVHKLSAVLRGGANTITFTKSLFDAVVDENGQAIVNSYAKSSYKGFYNGNTSITHISKKINTHLEPMEFSDYLNKFSDAAIENLCSTFSDDIPDITPFNACDKIAELFVLIITTAAGTNKKSATKDAKNTYNKPLGNFSDIAPEITEENAGQIFIINPELIGEINNTDEQHNPFQNYLDAAVNYYSTKKTLLYAEKPHPFYDLYVCNDIRYSKHRSNGFSDSKIKKTINNVTIDKLEAESKYIIIQGTGGIGKSMLLTHLFLSSAQQAKETGKTPLFLSLKDYKDSTSGMIDFIWKSLKEYDLNLNQSEVVNALQSKQLILLLDGLDEINSSAISLFEQDLEAFIKSYSGIPIIITSRPVSSFVSYSKFSVFDILELSKDQAHELVDKLEFWDLEGKIKFLEALDENLYTSHYQFASNPLLLTIMLMTYSSFGEVPAKMHVFYAKAFETMARLHDATKGSFKRPLHTGLTPEEFAKYFSQFCARTYTDEILEFDPMLFTAYMKKVLKGAKPEHQNINPRDFMLDLTNNLCIMYHEGNKYYFIHRSFQEYFSAVYFASEYDSNLYKVGTFFENMKNRSYTDRTFDMLYDMIPEKIERFIFLPYLEKLISKCCNGNGDEYWNFLELIYPRLTYEEGNPGESYINEATSFTYRSIVKVKRIEKVSDIYYYDWPAEIYNLPKKVWVEAYTDFLDQSAYDKYPNPNYIPESSLFFTSVVLDDEIPYQYTDYFDTPSEEGITIEIDVRELRRSPDRYAVIRECMEKKDFPIFLEYQSIKNFYSTLKKRTEMEIESEDLFDD